MAGLAVPAMGGGGPAMAGDGTAELVRRGCWATHRPSRFLRGIVLRSAAPLRPAIRSTRPCGPLWRGIVYLMKFRAECGFDFDDELLFEARVAKLADFSDVPVSALAIASRGHGEVGGDESFISRPKSESPDAGDRVAAFPHCRVHSTRR